MSATVLYKALLHAQVPEELAEKAVDDLPHADSLLTQAEFHNADAQIGLPKKSVQPECRRYCLYIGMKFRHNRYIIDPRISENKFGDIYGFFA